MRFLVALGHDVEIVVKPRNLGGQRWDRRSVFVVCLPAAWRGFCRQRRSHKDRPPLVSTLTRRLKNTLANL